MNTPFNELYYYVLRSNSEIDSAIWKSLMRKKSFNEKRYIKKTGIWPEETGDKNDNSTKRGT